MMAISAHDKTTTGGAASQWTTSQLPARVKPTLAHGSLAVITSAAPALTTNVYKSKDWACCEPTSGSQVQGESRNSLIQWSHGLAMLVNSAPLASRQCSADAVFAAAPPRGSPPLALEICGSHIVAAGTDEQIKLRGINWFGYNVVSVNPYTASKAAAAAHGMRSP
jgi:hypothetical protein